MPIDHPGSGSSSSRMNAIDRELFMLLDEKSEPSDEAIRRVVAKGATLDNLGVPLGHTALHMAAKNGYIQAIHTLIELGAAVDALNTSLMTPLLVAALNNQPAAIEALLQHNANVFHTNNTGSSALHIAASSYCAAALELLLKTPLRSQLEQRNDDGFTPLLEFCHILSSIHPDMCSYEKLTNITRTLETLLSAGSDATCCTPHSKLTPLMLCARAHLPELTKQLIPISGDLNRVNDEGESALFIAATRSCENTALLLQAGADTELRPNDGNTLAHMPLVTFNRFPKSAIKTLRLLAEWGIDMDQNGRIEGTPLEYAIENNLNNDIIHTLLDLGAQLPHGCAEPAERIKHARHRYEATLGATPPDLSTLTAPDLIGFSNAGLLQMAMRPFLWEGKREQLQAILTELPPYLAQQALQSSLDTPTALTTGWSHEGISMPAPKRSV